MKDLERSIKSEMKMEWVEAYGWQDRGEWEMCEIMEKSIGDQGGECN